MCLRLSEYRLKGADVVAASLYSLIDIAKGAHKEIVPGFPLQVLY